MDNVLSSYAVFRFLKKYKCFKFGVNRLTACPSRTPRSHLFWFGGVRVVFLFCLSAFYVLCPVLPVPFNCSFRFR